MLEDDGVFEAGRTVTLSAPTTAARETEIEVFRRQHGRCVIKFRGIDTISEAERYIGSEIKIPADTLPAAQEGSFYTFQLKGCRVFAVDGEYIGTITRVIDSGGTEILEVVRDDEETLIPFAQLYIKEIDIDQRRVKVQLPEDLRELNR